MEVVYCLIGVVVLGALIFLGTALKIVPEYQRLVVFRLGRCIGARGPGLIILIPFIDRAVRVDLREQVREIPAQTSITADNAPISIDFLWYYKVFDPVQSVLQVGFLTRCRACCKLVTLKWLLRVLPPPPCVR